MAVRQSGVAIPEAFHDLLEAKTVALIATIGPTGAPQASPVWFVLEAGEIRFRVSSRYQNYKNLQRDSRISITIVGPPRTDRYIEIRGNATALIAEIDEYSNDAIDVTMAGLGGVILRESVDDVKAEMKSLKSADRAEAKREKAQDKAETRFEHERDLAIHHNERIDRAEERSDRVDTWLEDKKVPVPTEAPN